MCERPDNEKEETSRAVLTLPSFTPITGIRNPAADQIGLIRGSPFTFIRCVRSGGCHWVVGVHRSSNKVKSRVMMSKVRMCVVPLSSVMSGSHLFTEYIQSQVGVGRTFRVMCRRKKRV